MKTWQKITTVAICGAAVWALSYCSSIWPENALVFSSFSAGCAALCGSLTGFTKEA